MIETLHQNLTRASQKAALAIEQIVLKVAVLLRRVQVHHVQVRHVLTLHALMRMKNSATRVHVQLVTDLHAQVAIQHHVVHVALLKFSL